MHIVHTHKHTHTGLVVNSQVKSKLARFEVKSTWVKSFMVWRNNSFIKRFIPETVTASKKNRWSQVSQQVRENGVPLSYHRKEWRPSLVPVSLNPLAPPALKLHAALLASQQTIIGAIPCARLLEGFTHTHTPHPGADLPNRPCKITQVEKTNIQPPGPLCVKSPLYNLTSGNLVATWKLWEGNLFHDESTQPNDLIIRRLDCCISWYSIKLQRAYSTIAPNIASNNLLGFTWAQ